MTDPSLLALLLDDIRSAHSLYSTVTRVEIDEYQLGILTEGGVHITSYVGWELVSSTGKALRIDADFRKRSIDSYAVCRVIGRRIASVDFDPGGNLVLQLDPDEKLLVLKTMDFENFMIGLPGKPGYSGVFIF